MKKQSNANKDSAGVKQFYEKAGIHPSVNNAAVRAIVHILNAKKRRKKGGKLERD